MNYDQWIQDKIGQWLVTPPPGQTTVGVWEPTPRWLRWFFFCPGHRRPRLGYRHGKLHQSWDYADYKRLAREALDREFNPDHKPSLFEFNIEAKDLGALLGMPLLKHDPHLPGAIWNDDGTIKVSQG